MRIFGMAGAKMRERNSVMNVPIPERVSYNLKMDAELIKQIKIWCIKADCTPSQMTEQLWSRFLREHEQDSKKSFRRGTKPQGNE